MATPLVSTLERQRDRQILGVGDQPGLLTKFQASLGYLVKPCVSRGKGTYVYDVHCCLKYLIGNYYLIGFYCVLCVRFSLHINLKEKVMFS